MLGFLDDTRKEIIVGNNIKIEEKEHSNSTSVIRKIKDTLQEYSAQLDVLLLLCSTFTRSRKELFREINCCKTKDNSRP